MVVVTTDPSRRLVHARMGGLLTIADVVEFSRLEHEAVAAMGLRSGEFLLLVETADDQVQTQEVMAAFQALMVDPPLKARRIAIVRHGMLPRMQSRRIAIRPDFEVFATVADAERWLFGD